MSKFARTGAVFFALWGLLHIAGAGGILAALAESREAAFSFYRQSEGTYPAAAGGIIGYFAFGLALTGAAVVWIAWRQNWQNNASGLALNTGLVAAVEVGLIIFLLIPGYLTIVDAAPGFVLFALAAVTGGMACRGEHDVARA